LLANGLRPEIIEKKGGGMLDLNPKDYIEIIGIIVSVPSFILGVMLPRSVKNSVIVFFRAIISKLSFSSKKAVFLCTDFSEAKTTNFSSHLQKATGHKFKFIEIHDPEELLRYPLKKSIAHAVIFLNTNVTPLSTDSLDKKKIQQSIKIYCENGGIAILAHDAIYRRTGNATFQAMVGGKIEKFHRYDHSPVNYVKNNEGPRKCENKSLIQHLREDFSLNDKEVLEGTWEKNIEFLYIHPETKNPLVTRTETGSGVVFWLNSGDHDGINPPASISTPETPLIDLISCILLHEKNKAT
jgi:hypothetical protein